MVRQKKLVVTLTAGMALSLIVLVGACSSPLSRSSVSIDDAIGKENIVPIAILGNGPAGLSSGIYAIWGGVRAVVFEGPLPGGLLTQTSLVENWPGNKSIQGPDIIKGLEAQVQGIGSRAKDALGQIEFIHDTVISVDLSRWPYKLMTENGVTMHAMSIILATGATPKLLGVPGEQEFWKSGVTTCAVCDGPFYKDQDVVVVGGGDSAAEEAMQLARHAKNITVLVRKDVMRASPIMQAHLKESPSIKIMYNVQVKEIVGKDNEVTGVHIYNSQTKETTLLPANGVFLAIGHTPNSQLVKSHVSTDEDGYIILQSRSQATNVPGVFAAGDVADRVYRQAGVASGHGIQAGLDAIAFLTSIGYNTKMANELKKNFYSGAATPKAELKTLATQADFDSAVLKKAGLTIIKCWRAGCQPCAQMAPVFEHAKEKFAGKVQFLQIDTMAAPELSEKLHIYGVPTLFVYRDGKLISRYSGAMNEAEFDAFIEKFLNPAE